MAKLPFDPLKDVLKTLLNTVEEKTQENEQASPQRGEVRKVNVPIGRATLPADAQNKGTRSIVIQDIDIKRDNIEFIIERYYSPSQQKAFDSELPEAYGGHEFGPNFRAFVITLHDQWHRCTDL